MTHEEIKVLLSQLDEKIQSLNDNRDYSLTHTIAYRDGQITGLNYAKEKIIEMERNKK